MKSGEKGFDICVRNPITHNTWGDGRYTTYEIAVETTNKAFSLPKSLSRRRYSEFTWLKNKLKDHHPLINPPKLPPRNLFSDRFSQEFVAFRMKGLEIFLNNVLKERFYVSDTTFHLFLQTDLSCKEIEDFLAGKLSEEYIQNLWKSGGKTETQSVSSGNGLLSGSLSDSSFEELDIQDSLSGTEDIQTSNETGTSSANFKLGAFNPLSDISDIDPDTLKNGNSLKGEPVDRGEESADLQQEVNKNNDMKSVLPVSVNFSLNGDEMS